MSVNRLQKTLFTIGDYLNGALIGGFTAAAVRGFAGEGTDMVIAMVAGIVVGMAVHLVIGLLMTPLLGMFHAMIPGSLIGMYGGMLFAMRDSMQGHVGSVEHAIGIGAAFGIVMTAALALYDRALRGSVTLRSSGTKAGV